MSVIHIVRTLVRSPVRDRLALAAKNLALWQLLTFLRASKKRPILRQRDRIFWAILSRIWSDWRSALLMVQPEAVIRGIVEASRSCGDG